MTNACLRDAGQSKSVLEKKNHEKLVEKREDVGLVQQGT